MFRSIRARFTLVYFLLVFVALILIGVFILRSFEDHYLEAAAVRLDEIRELLVAEIDKLGASDLHTASAQLQNIVNKHVDIGLREEVFLIDKQRLDIAASSSATLIESNINQLNGELVVEGLAGETAERDLVLSSNLRVKDKIYPLFKSGEQIGMIYLRYDLSDIYDMIHRSRIVIFQAVATTLVVSVFTSFVISKSITDPIKEVTKKARRLASGDFDQVIDVRSDDEIGEFSQTFNFLTRELKRSVTEITNEKIKLETIINNMDDGLVAISDQGDILQCNPRASELIGAVDAEEILALYEEHGEEETVILYRDGRSLRYNFAPFFDKASMKLGVILVIQDITEEHKLDTMRREFVANVSHELKTPLTSIISYAETLQEGAIEDRGTAEKFLGVIRSEGERMSRLVRDLLDLSNFDASKANLNKSWVDINKIVERCCQQLKLSADQHDQRIELTLCGKLSAYVDEDRIVQVLNNILSNALKYSPDDRVVRVSVSVEERGETADPTGSAPTPQESDRFVITVEDEGSGIPEADLPRVFERFYRVDKARSRSMGGSGLGLAIAKEIVEAHGGEIELESEADVGTTVRMRIPIFVKKK